MQVHEMLCVLVLENAGLPDTCRLEIECINGNQWHFFLACYLQQELYLYVYALFVTGGSTLQIQPNGIYT